MVLLKVQNNRYMQCLKKSDHLDLYLNPLKYLVGSTFLYGNRDRSLKFYIRSVYIAKLRLRLPVSHIIHNMVMKSRVKLEFLYKRVGGAYYYIPSFLDPKREISHTIKDMILLVTQSSAYARFGEKFTHELLNFYRRKGLFLEHRKHSHQLAIINRPYTNYLLRTDKRIFRKSFSKYNQYCMFYRTAFQSYLNTLDDDMFLEAEDIFDTKLSTTPLHSMGPVKDSVWYKDFFAKRVSLLIVDFLRSYNNVAVTFDFKFSASKRRRRKAILNAIRFKKMRQSLFKKRTIKETNITFSKKTNVKKHENIKLSNHKKTFSKNVKFDNRKKTFSKKFKFKNKTKKVNKNA